MLELLAEGSEQHMFFPAAQARVLLADVQLRLGRADLAAATLSPWLTQSIEGANAGGALLAGGPVLARLAAADWKGCLGSLEVAMLGSFASKLQFAVPESLSSRALAMSPTHAVGVAPAQLAHLSDREREVLARLAAGDSNKLIARAFDLSPHTVKRHVANILDKLGVATRGQAAARWRGTSGDTG
jgi:LuxR family maltose regulon positive regulatory protein